MNDIVTWCLGLFLAGLLGLAVVSGVQESKEWEAFKAAHDCKKVAHIKGNVFNTVSVGGNGQVQIGIGSTPNKTGWACNDGITYYR